MERTLTGRIFDAWMQHPTVEFWQHPMLDSIHRWRGTDVPADLPAAWTVSRMDQAGVAAGMLCAWWAPNGPLITNDDVAAIVERWPQRLAGVASVDLSRPMDAVRELRRCVRELGFKAQRIVPWLWDMSPDDRR